jgi:hypothetical protein
MVKLTAAQQRILVEANERELTPTFLTGAERRTVLMLVQLGYLSGTLNKVARITESGRAHLASEKRD